MGVAILRTRDLMDYSGVIAGEEEMDMLAMPASKSHADLARVESGLSGEFCLIIQIELLLVRPSGQVRRLAGSLALGGADKTINTQTRWAGATP
jgi:hypothetical protein